MAIEYRNLEKASCILILFLFRFIRSHEIQLGGFGYVC